MHNREEVHMQKRHVLRLQDRIDALDARNLLNSTILKECNASTRIYHKYGSLKKLIILFQIMKKTETYYQHLEITIIRARTVKLKNEIL